ncbi:UNVERIFIED_CONTAM: Nucleotide-sugar uncharacterized transporter 2 [Sesamum angustifolium]|uniref:Nucleotide-sugar uncharacterized transporter 2 n=1 Tax=Sesamum angustifolium TaxID=2727405 RepID=A0AAW2PWA4_9LAMI
MLNFLIRKDVRKILKRKDSDAGERGRALEELRASMFSKLRLIDGAKRQQQSLWGPTVALTFNFLVSVSIILMNKLVLVRVGFNYPIFLTFIHYVVSWLIMALLKTLSILSLSSPPKSTKYSSLLSLGIVMSLSTGLANVSLKYNSVGFYQMAKIAVTPAIVLAEFILFRKRISVQKVLALTVVSIGVAVATVTDLQFHFFGACIAVAWIIPSAVNKILWSNLQQQDNWSALALMWKTTPITLFFLVMMMPSLDPPGVLSFDWNFYNSATIGGSAVLGFLLQWSGALALGNAIAMSLTMCFLIDVERPLQRPMSFLDSSKLVSYFWEAFFSLVQIRANKHSWSRHSSHRSAKKTVNPTMEVVERSTSDMPSRTASVVLVKPFIKLQF